MTSRLLEPDLLEPDAIRLARMFALEDSGLLAAHPPGAPALAASATQVRQLLKGGPALAEWQRAVAAELLLLAQWDRALATELACAASLQQQQPFAGGPALADLLDASAALAVAPLDVASGPPILQVWVLQPGEDGRDWETPGEASGSRLEGAGQPAENGCRVVAVPPLLRSPPKGPSWKLAAALAQRALHEPGPRARGIRSLALDWFVTGDVDAETVARVELGGKRRLAVEDDARGRRRSWLVPRHCWNKDNDSYVLLREHLRGRLRAVTTLREAWAHVNGGGFIETREERSWPTEPVVFHAFVSDALGPIVAPLLLQETKEAIFWLSEEKAHLFQAIEDFVRIGKETGLIRGNLIIHSRGINAGSLEEAEVCLLEAEELRAGGPVLFNITGGNIPMRLALAELARTNSSLRLIYRPEGGERGANHYLELTFPEGLPRTRRLKPRPDRADGLISLGLPSLAKEWGCSLSDAFVRWCIENLMKYAPCVPSIPLDQAEISPPACFNPMKDQMTETP
jgi:hypothetical protein